MNSLELTTLRKQLLQEKIKGDRIRLLQTNSDVIEYMRLRGISKMNIETEKEMLARLLNKCVLTPTNNIWILTGSFITDIGRCDEDAFEYNRRVGLFDPEAEIKEFRNLESISVQRLHVRRINDSPTSQEFMQDNIVINPTNGIDPMNGFYDVRNEFVYNAVTSGEANAKALLLYKYKRIR